MSVISLVCAEHPIQETDKLNFNPVPPGTNQISILSLRGFCMAETSSEPGEAIFARLSFWPLLAAASSINDLTAFRLPRHCDLAGDICCKTGEQLSLCSPASVLHHTRRV